jgi:NADH-quinone oxidoreductase subunit H
MLVLFNFKMFVFIVVYMLVRWTLPRFRFDQLMGLAWKVLIPLALINLVAVAVVKQLDASPWWLLLVSIGLIVGAGLVATQAQPPPQRREIDTTRALVTLR